MKSGNILMIVNPVAGKMKSKRGLFTAAEIFCRRGYEVSVSITGGKGDARRIAAERGGGYSTVVAVGGDGTFSEVVSGLIDGGHSTPIGYIPAGTTNDFAATLGLPKSIAAAAGVIAEGEVQSLDAGCFCGDGYFTYIASCGAFTKTSYSTPQSVKNIFGHLSYVFEGIKELSEIKPRIMTFRGKGIDITEEVLFAAVANTTSIGGVIGLPKDDVRMNDGLLELLVIKKPGSRQELNNLIVKLTKKDLSDGNIILEHLDSVSISSEEKLSYTLDGEWGGEKDSADISVIPGAFNIILPKK
ncbi:MAG: diacylglycerol kinase family lipid kinase [Clostridia bacterium]|nr:diacylglycerol kinase family lipid kinase [Clostridia bacterium]